jgi:hypothetical protein
MGIYGQIDMVSNNDFKLIFNDSNHFLTIKNNYGFKLLNLIAIHHLIEKKEQN